MKLSNIETGELIKELVNRGYQVTKIPTKRPTPPKPINWDNVLVISLETGVNKKQQKFCQCFCNHPLCPICNRKRK